MVQVKKWLTNTAEAMLSPWLYEVEITSVSQLSIGLKLVIFSGDFHKANFQPGQDALFRVEGNQLRHYTLATFDAEKGTCAIIFYLNDKGPGGRWAADLLVGNKLKFAAVKRRNCYDEDATHHFFFGDETAVGCFEWFKNIALQNDQEYFGVLELKTRKRCGAGKIKNVDRECAAVYWPYRGKCHTMDAKHASKLLAQLEKSNLLSRGQGRLYTVHAKIFVG